MLHGAEMLALYHQPTCVVLRTMEPMSHTSALVRGSWRSGRQRNTSPPGNDGTGDRDMTWTGLRFTDIHRLPQFGRDLNTLRMKLSTSLGPAAALRI
jgi:hypothetical protein